MTDLNKYITISDGLRIRLWDCTEIRRTLNDEIDYTADLNLDWLRDGREMEMED